MKNLKDLKNMDRPPQMKDITSADIDKKYVIGICAIVAIIAAVIERRSDLIGSASAVGAIKIIACTFAILILLVEIIKAFEKNMTKFRTRFEYAMEPIEQNYSPMITKHEPENETPESADVIRYDILSSTDALFRKKETNHLCLFELSATNPQKISFYVREEFFGKPFDAVQIAADIAGRLQETFKDYEISHSADESGATIDVIFNKTLEKEQDLSQLMDLINLTILLFIAKHKEA